MLKNILSRAPSLFLFASIVASAPAYTATSSKLGALDPSQNFVVSSPVENASSLATKIRTVMRYPNATAVYAKDYSYSSSRYNEPIQLRVDAAGNVYVLGDSYTNNFATSTLFLLKYSPTGTLLWSKPYTSASLAADSLALDSAGNPYVVADWNGVGRILKYNTSGTITVNKVLQPQAYTVLGQIAIDPSNRVYVGGQTSSGLGGTTYSVVARYDTSLNQIWQATAPITTSNAYNNTGISVDASGNVYTSFATLDPVNNTYVTTVQKNALATGSPTWSTVISTDGNDGGGGLILDAAGDVVVAGEQILNALSSMPTYYLRIAKLSGSTGTVAWNTAYTQNANSPFTVSAVAQEAGGTYVAVGTNRVAATYVDQILTPIFDGNGVNAGYFYVAPNEYNHGVSIVPTTTANSFYIGGTTDDGNGVGSYPLQARVLNNVFQWCYWWNGSQYP